MLKVGESVVVVPADRNRAEQLGYIFGLDGEYVWVYCPDSRELYRSNPNRFIVHEDRQVLFDYDHCRSVDNCFDQSGECKPEVFFHSSDDARSGLVKRLKVLRLVML